MTARGTTILTLWCLAAAALTAGCSCRCPELSTIVPLDQLVKEYNDNAAPAYRLWAQAKVKLALPTGLGVSYPAWVSVSPLAENNALLLLFKSDRRLPPHDFVLIGSETGEEIFRAGCSTEQGVYYFWLRYGKEPALLWGRNEYAGAPGVKGLPIDPMQILAVLSICELPDDFTEPPTVALSMNTTPGQCAYVVTYLDRQPISNRILFRREVHFRWHKDETRRPFRVKFFDGRGVRVLTADLKDYQPVTLAGAPPDTPQPVMPTDIRITWPQEETSIHMILSEMVVDDGKGFREACDLWDEDGLPPHPFAKTVQVDRDVEKGSGENQ